MLRCQSLQQFVPKILLDLLDRIRDNGLFGVYVAGLDYVQSKRAESVRNVGQTWPQQNSSQLRQQQPSFTGPTSAHKT